MPEFPQNVTRSGAVSKRNASRASIFAAFVALLALATVPAPSLAQSTRTLSPAWTDFTRAWSSIAGYSATVTIFEQKGAKAQNIVLDYTYRKPSNATVRIVQGTDAGVTLVWNGGSTIQAHRGSGLAALFKRTMALDDPAATTIRGSSIDQVSFDGILAHAQQIAGVASQSPGIVVKGVATDEVRLVPSNPASDDGLTLEVVDLSQSTHLPVRVLGYEGSVLVRSISFTDVKLQTN